MSDPIAEALYGAGVQLSAALYGISREGWSRYDVRRLRIYARDLRAMTVEELESAIVGFDITWESLDDEPTPIHVDPFVPNGTIVGLSGWLP